MHYALQHTAQGHRTTKFPFVNMRYSTADVFYSCFVTKWRTIWAGHV